MNFYQLHNTKFVNTLAFVNNVVVYSTLYWNYVLNVLDQLMERFRLDLVSLVLPKRNYQLILLAYLLDDLIELNEHPLKYKQHNYNIYFKKYEKDCIYFYSMMGLVVVYLILFLHHQLNHHWPTFRNYMQVNCF